MSTECGICIEPYTKTSRKCVTCPACDYKCCVGCLKRYVIDDTTQEAHCMNCKVAFTNSFLSETFTKTWNNNEYRNHRTNLLMVREKSLLPDTEGYIQGLAKANILKGELKELTNEIKEIEDLVYKDKLEIEKEIDELERIIHKKRVDILNMSRNMRAKTLPLHEKRNVLNTKIQELIDGKVKEKKERRKFLMNCCMDGCKGYINNKYKCGICETQMCPKCQKVDGEGHVCNEDDVKTVEEIKKTCKSCPKCGIPTQKISGCPQMWCIDCHAVWNWNTGELDKSGRIHNPHYFQFLRNGDPNGIRRERGDVLCGGDVTPMEMRQSFLTSNTTPGSVQMKQGMMDVGFVVMQDVNHVTGHEMTKYREADESVLRNLRAMYLQNQITENEWKSELKKYEKKERKKKDYREVLGLYGASMQDLLRNSIEMKDLQIKEMIQLKEYTNEVLAQLNQQYQIKGFQLKKRELFARNVYVTTKQLTHV